MDNIPNLAVEKIASCVMLPCNYTASGCAASLLLTERREHEETCAFRPYYCPFPNTSCKWQGSLEEVVPHLMMSHKLVTGPEHEDHKSFIPVTNEPGKVVWAFMLWCFDHHFILAIRRLQTLDVCQQFCFTLQLIGTRKQAENFVYELKLKGQRISRTWTAKPRSIHQGVPSANMNSVSDDDVFDPKTYVLNGKLNFCVSLFMV
jgi:E3 ubiquitin-protein ligase SIAH1